jgi:hypothetical protein
VSPLHDSLVSQPLFQVGPWAHEPSAAPAAACCPPCPTSIVYCETLIIGVAQTLARFSHLPIHIVVFASCRDRLRRLITAQSSSSPANRDACFQGLTDREEVYERRGERQAANQHPAKVRRRNRPPQKGAYSSVLALIPQIVPSGQTPLCGPSGWLPCSRAHRQTADALPAE